MRLFIAIEPSAEFRGALISLQDKLREAGVTGRYTPPENLHLTLAFIGEWPENIAEMLPAVKKPFEIKLSHIGFFPGADVLWAGLMPSEALENTAKRVRHALSDSGIPFDRKAFSAHITLIRKPSIPKSADVSIIEVPNAVMNVEEISLYRSDRGKNGMVYTVIGSSEH